MPKLKFLFATMSLSVLLLSGCAVDHNESFADYDLAAADIDVQFLKDNGVIPLNQMNVFQQYQYDCVMNSHPDAPLMPTSDDGMLMVGDIDRFSDIFDKCDQEAESNVRLTEEQKSELYQQELANVDCLREEGHEIVDIPTEQSYKDNWSRRGAWTAINQIRERTFVGEPPYSDEMYAKIEDLYLKCPPPVWSYQINN